MEKFLEIYTYDENLVGKVAFPNDLEAPIRLYDFTYQSSRMEIPTLTAKLKYPECLDSKWTQREFIEFNGEKFWVAQTPSSAKDNTDGRFSHDITFISERAILSNIYFFDDVTTESNGNYGESYSSHSANVTFFGDLNEFVRRINASLSKSGVDYRVSIDVNKIINDSKISEVKEFTCDKVFVLDALKQAFEVWDIPFYFKGNNIIFADYENDITNEPLAYGIGNELLKIERNNTNKKIVTRATGVGSSENIPHYYPNETTKGNFNFYLLDKDDKEIASKVDDTLKNIRFIDENKFVNNVVARNSEYGWNSFYIYEQKLTNETTIEELSNIQYAINNGQWKKYKPVAGEGIKVGGYYNYATVNFSIDFKTANIGQSLKLELLLNLGYYENDIFYSQGSTQGALGSAKSIELYKKYFDADTEKFQYRNIAYIGNASSVIGATDGVPNTTYNWDFGTEFEAGEYRLIINEIPIEHPQYDEGLNNAGLGFFYFWFNKLVITREVKETYSYQWVNSLDNTKRIKSLRQVGVDYVENIETDLGKKFYYVITSKVVYQSTLMPSIFTRGEAFNKQIKSNEIGVERFYDAINGTYEGITFVNPLNAYNRSEQIYEYEDIKPTIEGVINAAGEPIYKVKDVAYDADDNDYTIGEEKNDNTLENAENYAHPYFYVKLAKTDGEFGFNLFDCISEGNSMTFQIRSGNLAGCKFKVQAKEEGTNIFKNPVQVYTENAEDGSYKKGDIVLGNKDKKIDLANLQPEQQDTSANEVWIALLKEEDTFGVVMPNVENKYLMAAYDEFNIIGINLPKAYIRFAEKQLDDAIVEDMRKDNEEVFNYSIDLSRIFIANDYKANGDNSWLSTLNEASYISLKYNDKVVSQYVSSYTYECKSGELLPKISIDITNHIQKEVTLVENITKSTVSTVDKNLGQRTKTIISDSKLATAKTVSTKATKSTTLSGYGIQDARIEEDGTIVLGEKSIKIGTSTQLRPSDDSITIDNSFIKVNTEDSLDSESTQRPLSAKQGKTINDLIHTMFTPHYDEYGILESVQVNAGLWSYSYISTKGISDATGGGGGTGFDVTRMWQELYNAPTSYSKTINKQHLPTPLSRITDNNYNEWNRVASSITTSKIDTWDSASAWVASITGSDSDTVINKWDEIVEFLNGIEETTLNSILIQKFNAKDFTKSNIQSTLGIYDWALASTKPSYTFSEIGSKPTTLSGYGITDAQKIGAKWENTNYYTLEVNSNADNRVESLYYANGVVQFSLSISDGKLSLWNRVSNKSLQIDSSIRFSGSELQKAVYDYVNVAGTANDTAMANVLAPSDYNGTNSLGGIFKFYDTKFYNGQSNISNRCQLAYGYDVDSIHYRRYSGGKWNDWKKVVFTDVDSLTPAGGILSIVGALSVSSSSEILGLLQAKGSITTPTLTATTSVKIGDATISWDSTNQMLKIDKGIYSLGAISAKGVSNSTGETGGGVDLTTMWDSLRENNALNVIHISHIPTLSTTKIADFASSVQALLPNVPTNVSELVNDAGYLTATAITNKADKDTSLTTYYIADYDLTKPYSLKTSGAFIARLGGNSTNIPDGSMHGNLLHVQHFNQDTSFELYSGYNNGGLWYRSGNNNTLYTNEWKKLAFEATTLAGYGITDAVTLDTAQTITGVKTFSNGLSTTKISGITDSSVVANLNANYLGGLNKDSFQKAVYDYVNVSGTADTTALSTVLAPSDYNGTNSLGGIFKFYDTKFYDRQSNTSNRCQLAYGYDVDSIHFRRYYNGTWYDWKKVAWEDEVVKTGADITAPNVNVTAHLSAGSATFANGDISIGSNGLIMNPALGINIGDYLTVNGGTTEIWGDYFKIGAASTRFYYNVNINGDANISSMVTTDRTNGVLGLDGNYINVLAPMNVLSTIKIGNATLSYDYNSGMLLIDKGIASSGAISTKGISNASAGIASAQFGLIYEDYWRLATNSELASYGATATLFSGDNATNNGTIVIACDAFNNKTIADVDVFVVGYGEAPSSAMALVPYKIDGNKCYFRLNATQISGFTGFKIKVY